ncbi:ribonuclease P/MRP protein subunit POP5-like [Watersipora subatra]|uniref:ribonuclease P/MRP protein subunit POP5-like n=1 Tax=Watersipora subatra TaxID=2589382 RepID=UPI00355C64CD
MVRVKHRYLLAEIVYADNRSIDATDTQIYQAIRDAFTEGFGEYGIALIKRSLSIRIVMRDTRMILVRVRRGAETMLSNALTTINSLNKTAIRMVTRHVSGSIRCAQKYWIRMNRRLLQSAIRECKESERQKLLEKIKEINQADFSELFKPKRLQSKS